MNAAPIGWVLAHRLSQHRDRPRREEAGGVAGLDHPDPSGLGDAQPRAGLRRARRPRRPAAAGAPAPVATSSTRASQ